MIVDLRHGDCVAVMATLEAESLDSIVCDPPYLLAFMSKSWDSVGVNDGAAMQAWHYKWAIEAIRILKPGGHLLAFGGTRTFHRLACALENAGFEYRDTLCWMYGSGFPKSLDVSKAIDKAAGAEREVTGVKPGHENFIGRDTHPLNDGWNRPWASDPVAVERYHSQTAPSTDSAKEWSGWGTALKPAWEPILMVRKPFAGTVAANVQEYGTGALNIDGCRIDSEAIPINKLEKWSGFGQEKRPDYIQEINTAGRWPANVALDEGAAHLLNEQVGELTSGEPMGIRHTDSLDIFGKDPGRIGTPVTGYGDTGGASRFFYTSKSSRWEREVGLHGSEQQFLATMGNGIGEREHNPDEPTAWTTNNHPTVKPIDLMRWLVRMVTRVGGTVLDPFTGSGTTGCAAVIEGMNFIGIEQDAGYIQIAKKRIEFWSVHQAPDVLNPELARQIKPGTVIPVEVRRGKKVDPNQESLF